MTQNMLKVDSITQMDDGCYEVSVDGRQHRIVRFLLTERNSDGQVEDKIVWSWEWPSGTDSRRHKETFEGALADLLSIDWDNKGK